jgi:hypothetical protein
MIRIFGIIHAPETDTDGFGAIVNEVLKVVWWEVIRRFFRQEPVSANLFVLAPITRLGQNAGAPAEQPGFTVGL